MRNFVMTLAASALLMAACGPETSTSTETPTTDEPTSGGSTMTAPTIGGELCEEFMSEEESGELVTINIVNTGAETLWVDVTGCQGIPAMFIADSEGNEVQRIDDMCPIPLCDDLLTGDCERGCSNCLPPSGMRLDPGAKFGMLWSGDNVETREMTAECAPGEGCAGECVVGFPRPAGLYEVTVTAYLECSGDCACQPSNPEDLWCHTQDDISTSQPLVVTVPFDYPKVTTVEIEIGA